MFKRKISKVTKAIKQWLKSGKDKKQWLMCKECDEISVEVGMDISAVTCAYCVQKQLPPPENIKPKEPGEKFPRGWALKARYVHTDGRVFEKGKETGEVVTPEEPKAKATPKKKVAKKTAKKKSPKRRK